jgi:hypothetical protein
MGENKHIEEIDAFAKKYLKEIPTETPSLDFTANLLHKIGQLEPVKKAIVFQPLISKKVWVALGIILLISILLVLNTGNVSGLKFPSYDLSTISFPELTFGNLFSSIQISNSVLYLGLFFTCMFFIQIFYLKGVFEKRIDM